MGARGAPRILFVGRYDEQRKGFKYLLRAMPLIRHNFPEARLGGRRHGRPRKVRRSDERDGIWGVDFVGFVSARNCHAPTRAAIFLRTIDSWGELRHHLAGGHGTGRPVIASNIPGYASVITNGGKHCWSNHAIRPRCAGDCQIVGRCRSKQRVAEQGRKPRRITLGPRWPIECANHTKARGARSLVSGRAIRQRTSGYRLDGAERRGGRG